jgi:hypothetical protein
MFQPLAVPANRVIERIEAHRKRERAVGESAAAKVRERGGSALDAACADIRATFDSSARALKLRVLRAIKRGTGHPANRARYGARVAQLHERLPFLYRDPQAVIGGACAILKNWYRDEKRAYLIAAALGRGNRLSLDVLAELRLMLRLLRRSPYRNHLARIVSFFLSGHDYQHEIAE